MPSKRRAGAGGSPGRSSGRPSKMARTDITDSSVPETEANTENQSLADIPVVSWGPQAFPRTIDIVPDGDIILVVGPEATQFRVYSRVLKVSSKFFKEVLNLPVPGAVRLPDKDADGMNIVMQVLHRPSIAMNTGLTAELVRRSAITADKLGCAEALSSSLNPWLNNINYRTLGSDQAFILVEAMYWLNNEEAYRGFMLHLILNHQGTYLDLWGYKSGDIRPEIVVRILRAMENHRDLIRRHLVHLAFDNSHLPNPHRLPTCSPYCQWVKANCDMWRERLYATGILQRIMECSVIGVLQIAVTIPEPNVPPHRHCKGPTTHRLPDGLKFNQMTFENVKKLRSLAALMNPRGGEGMFS